MEPEQLTVLAHFSGMSPEEIAVVAGTLRDQQWADGSSIVRQGEKGGGVYFLIDGHIRIDRKLREGEIVTVGQIGPGAVFGVLGVIDGVPRAASCVAQGAVRCAVMERIDFMDLMSGASPLAMRFQISILRYLARDIRSTNRKLAELVAVPACAVTVEDLEEIFPELGEDD